MRDRPTVRVVLLDPAGRVLLMKGRLPSAPDGPGAWFTIGGGVEPGETLVQAAMREIREETGFTDVALGPVIWVRQGVMRLAGDEEVRMVESYLVATCPGGEPDRAGWDALEKALIDDIAWWDPADLAVCPDRVFPSGLTERLTDVVEGRYPTTPTLLDWP